MEIRKQFRMRLLGIAAGVLTALLIWPGTRWVVLAQMARLIPGRPSAAAWAADITGHRAAGSEGAARAAHAAAGGLPDDYSIQLADALAPGPYGTLEYEVRTAHLRDLARRFPDRPSVYANVLRFATMGAVLMHRDEELLLVPSASGAGVPKRRAIDPGKLAVYDRDAAEGERLDPDNAYFPVMRAAGLFAGHRDAEALAALHRSAQRPLWIEYYDDELDGEWRLQERVFGNSGALPRVAFFAALLLPQYSQIRAVARMAVASAMLAEKAGRIEQGLAIREDVMRCGGLMRAESRTIIGSLVGSAVAITAMQRPGGAPAIKAVSNSAANAGKNVHERLFAESGKEMRDRLVAQYDAYLKQAGHMEHSAQAHGEAAAATRIREIGVHTRAGDVFGTMLLQLGISWWTNLQLLCATLWILVIGAVCALVYHRNRRLRSGLPLPQWASRGVALGSIAAVLSGVAIIPAAVPAPALWLGSVVLFGLLALALPPANRAHCIQTLAAYTGALVAVGCLLMLFAWHVNATVDPMRRVVLLLTYGGEQGPEPVNRGFQMLFTGSSMADLGCHLVTVAAAAIVPLLAAMAFWFISRVNRVPLSVALVRGFRGCAVPVACVLFLTYAALLPLTLRLESAAEDGIRRSLRHEGRYLAGLSGMEWPGTVP